MGIVRKLEEVDRELALLAGQGKVVGFLANTQIAQKINDLVDRSQALSAQSKMFYKTAKKVRAS